MNTSAEQAQTERPRPRLAWREPANSHVEAIAAVLVFVLCVLVTHPVLEMGLNDDFSYIRTALDFSRTGHFVYNGWATAMLGWQVAWGALFIKLFGFSFTIVRVSTVLLAAGTTYLLHRVMVRSSIAVRNATIGTLTVVLSPLFLPLACSFMSDVPGFFCIVLCLYACQRAVLATSDRVALAWLSFAAASNVAGGTARQIAWLGVLVMVPSAAWLLRRRRGIIPVIAPLWCICVVAVFWCMHWFRQRPYSVHESLIDGPIHRFVIPNLLNASLWVLLSLLFFSLPVLIAFLTRRVSSAAQALNPVAVKVLWALLIPLALIAAGVMRVGLLPWLDNGFSVRGLISFREVLGQRPVVLHAPVRAALTLLTLASAIWALPFATSHAESRLDESFPHLSGRELLVLLGPFTLSYLAVLAPIGALHSIFDRYLIPLLPVCVICILRYYQRHVSARLPRLSMAVLLLFSAYALAGTHDLFAMDRARLAAAEEVRRSGVPRTAIQAGVEYDGWTQIDASGYLNDPRIEVPSGAYHPARMPDPANPCEYWFEPNTPVVLAQYYLSFQPLSCLAVSQYPAVEYRTWLPPFHQRIYVLRSKSEAGANHVAR